LAQPRTISALVLLQRIEWTRTDKRARKQAHALKAGGVGALPQASKRKHGRQQQQGRRYHAQTMTEPKPLALQAKRAAYALAFACGPVGAWIALQIGLGLPTAACTPLPLLSLLLIAPIAEETVFRRGLQNWLLEKITLRFGPLSLANALVALIFGSLHALHQGSALMLVTVVPALVFGWLWELSGRRLLIPILFHAWYNLCVALASCP
jgi:hypothetical protein